MKKSIAIITAVFVLTVSGFVFAQTDDKGKDTMGDKSGMMEGKGGMMGGRMMKMMGMMGGMHEMMIKMSDMMHKTVVPTPDGGIIIVGTDTITKYDKDLNVVKVVDLKSDTDSMKTMMSQMTDKCSMMGKGMMGASDKDSDKDDDADEHAAHHPEQ